MISLQSNVKCHVEKRTTQAAGCTSEAFWSGIATQPYGSGSGLPRFMGHHRFETCKFPRMPKTHQGGEDTSRRHAQDCLRSLVGTAFMRRVAVTAKAGQAEQGIDMAPNLKSCSFSATIPKLSRCSLQSNQPKAETGYNCAWLLSIVRPSPLESAVLTIRHLAHVRELCTSQHLLPVQNSSAATMHWSVGIESGVQEQQFCTR